MSATSTPSHGGGTSGGQRGSQRGGCAIAVVAVFVLFLIVYWVTDGFDTDDAEFYSDESDRYSEYKTYLGSPIPRFTPQDAQSLSQSLARAEQRYDVCFGWRLTDGSMDAESSSSSSSVSDSDPRASYDQGSSRGPDVPAETCSRWVEVQVTVAYTSESSDDWSGVDLEIEASENFPRSKLPDDDRFAELGITAEQFIDAPVPTTGHAALALPLLLTQSGLLNEPAPSGDSADSKPAQPLPPAESEGSMAWIWVGVLGALTAVAAVLGIVGLVRSRSNGSGPSGPPPGPPGPPPNPSGPGPQSSGPPQAPPPGQQPPGQPPQGQPPRGQQPQGPPHGQHPQGPPPGLPYRGGPPPGPPGSHPWPPQPPHGQPPQGPPPAPR